MYLFFRVFKYSIEFRNFILELNIFKVRYRVKMEIVKCWGNLLVVDF